MKLFATRLWYTLLWIIALAIIVPLLALIFPIALLIKAPESFKEGWPRKILPPKMFIPITNPVSKVSFSQN